MAKKIKRKSELSEAEQKAAEETKAQEASQAAAGIQDEFQAKGFELVEWVQDREVLVLGILIAVLVGGFGFAGARAYGKSKDKDASAALAQGLEALEAPVGDADTAAEGAPPATEGKRYKTADERNAAAKALFQSASDAHAGRGAGIIAQLYLGHTALKSGDYDGAVKAYESFLTETPKNDPMRFAGLEGWAAALEAKNDKKGAIAKLEELVNLDGQIDEDAALFSLGRLYEEEGDSAKAKAAYERITKDFPESNLKAKADEKLTLLGQAAPSGAAASGAAPSGAAPSGAAPSGAVP